MEKENIEAADVYSLLLIEGNHTIELGKKLLGSEDEVWLITFEPATSQTVTTEDDVDDRTMNPAKFLIYTQKAQQALRGTDIKAEVPVHEISYDKVTLATRVTTAEVVLAEIKALMGGDAAVREAARNGQTTVAQSVG